MTSRGDGGKGRYCKKLASHHVMNVTCMAFLELGFLVILRFLFIMTLERTSNMKQRLHLSLPPHDARMTREQLLLRTII